MLYSGQMAEPQIYSPEYYQQIYDLEEKHWWYLGLRAIAFAVVRAQRDIQHDLRVLDAGCGTGVYLAWAREELAPRAVAGVDISLHALALGQHRGENSLAQASIIELPFSDGVFDLAFCHDVLQHLQTDGSDLRALKEIGRVLRPGGCLLLRTNSRWGMPRRPPDQDFQQYLLNEVVELLRAAGFQILTNSYVNCLPSLYGSIKANLDRLRRPAHSHSHSHANASADSGGLYQGLNIRPTHARRPLINRLLVGIMGAEARFVASGKRRLPFGHSTLCLAMRPTGQ